MNDCRKCELRVRYGRKLLYCAAMKRYVKPIKDGKRCGLFRPERR